MEDSYIPVIVPPDLVGYCVCVTRTGVVNIDSSNDIYVNSESLTGVVRNQITETKPKTDFNGSFAARVTIVVQLLGDMEVGNADV